MHIRVMSVSCCFIMCMATQTRECFIVGWISMAGLTSGPRIGMSTRIDGKELGIMVFEGSAVPAIYVMTIGTGVGESGAAVRLLVIRGVTGIAILIARGREFCFVRWDLMTT